MNYSRSRCVKVIVMPNDSELELKINPEKSYLSLKTIGAGLGVIVAGASWCTYVAMTMNQLKEGQDKGNSHLTSIEGKMDTYGDRVTRLEFRVDALEEKTGIHTVGPK